VCAHVIRNPAGRPGGCSTSRTFRSQAAAEREAAAWRAAGWTARVVPGPAPRPTCGHPYCARLYEHAHDDRRIGGREGRS